MKKEDMLKKFQSHLKDDKYKSCVENYMGGIAFHVSNESNLMVKSKIGNFELKTVQLTSDLTSFLFEYSEVNVIKSEKEENKTPEERYVDKLLKLTDISKRVLTDIINGDVDEWVVDDEVLNAEQLLEMFKKETE